MSDLPQAELLRSLKRIVSDLATKKVSVSQIKSKEDRVKYVESLGTNLPDLSKRTGTPAPLDRLATQALAKSQAKGGASARARSLLDRKTLIPPQNQCPLNISDQKLQQMCKELRKLPLETYPVAIAAAFRVFLELSLDHFADIKKLAGYNDGLHLRQKLPLVATQLQSDGASKRDLQGFRALASNTNAALSIDRLHGVIHSRYALPTPNELRTGWAEVQMAFTKIWS